MPMTLKEHREWRRAKKEKEIKENKLPLDMYDEMNKEEKNLLMFMPRTVHGTSIGNE